MSATVLKSETCGDFHMPTLEGLERYIKERGLWPQAQIMVTTFILDGEWRALPTDEFDALVASGDLVYEVEPDERGMYDVMGVKRSQ